MDFEVIARKRFTRQGIVPTNFIRITRIMHQPLPVTHKEGVGDGDGQIIHPLRARFNRDYLDPPVAAVELAHEVACSAT